jgi:hypothetical protein
VISIRTLLREDLPDAIALFQRVMGCDCEGLAPGVAEFLEAATFGSPWTDDDLPSLAAVDGDGRIVGWIGVGLRRMRFGDQPVRMVVCSNLVVDPAFRHLAVGTLLLRQVLDGPQDVTISDTPSEAVRRMWLLLGGESVAVESIHWVRLLRPCQTGLQVLEERLGGGRRLAWAESGARLLDRAAGTPARRRLEPILGAPTDEPLTPESLLDALPGCIRRLTLVPAYDRQYLEWLFASMDRGERHGRVVARMVRGADGARVGWFVYSLRPGRRSEVLQIVARSERDAERVLEHLAAHAFAHGAAALRGRLESQFVAPVARQRSLLRYGWAALIHSRDPRLRDAIQSGRALLTRLDGEWWWSDALVDRGAK